MCVANARGVTRASARIAGNDLALSVQAWMLLAGDQVLGERESRQIRSSRRIGTSATSAKSALLWVVDLNASRR